VPRPIDWSVTSIEAITFAPVISAMRAAMLFGSMSRLPATPQPARPAQP